MCYVSSYLYVCRRLEKISCRVFSLNHKTKFYFENGDIHLHKKITCPIVVYCWGPDEIQFNGLKTQRLLKPLQVYLRRYNSCVTCFLYTKYTEALWTAEETNSSIRYSKDFSICLTMVFFAQYERGLLCRLLHIKYYVKKKETLNYRNHSSSAKIKVDKADHTW